MSIREPRLELQANATVRDRGIEIRCRRVEDEDKEEEERRDNRGIGKMEAKKREKGLCRKEQK